MHSNSAPQYCQHVTLSGVEGGFGDTVQNPSTPLRVTLFQGVALMLLLFLSACDTASTTSGTTSTGIIGRPLGFYMPRYLEGLEPFSMVLSVDPNVRRAHLFSGEDLSLMQSTKLPIKQDNQSLLFSTDGSYLLSIAEKEVVIVKADGNVIESPFQFSGEIISVAFSEEEHTYVFADSLGSIALLILSDEGEVRSTWTGGSLIDGEQFAGAGDILPGKTLLLSMGESSLAFVDIEASIEQQSWVFESLTLTETTDIQWMAVVPNQTRLVFIQSLEKLLVFDTTSRFVLQETSIDHHLLLGRFRDWSPHVITRTEANDEEGYHVFAASTGGEIVQQRLSSIPNAIIESIYDSSEDQITLVSNDDGFFSFIDFIEERLDYTKTKTLTEDDRHSNNDQLPGESNVAFSKFSPKQIDRIRLTDQLRLGSHSIRGSVRVAPMPDHIFVQYNSPLGYVILQDYQGNTIRSTDSFNLPFL